MRVGVPFGVLLLVLCAFASPAQAAKKKEESSKTYKSPLSEKVTASTSTIAMVEHFLKSKTGELDPDLVPDFMAIDPESLPDDLRPKYQAKRAELNALRRIAEGNKKPPLRRLGIEKEAVCTYEEGDMRLVKTLRSMGFAQISANEENYLLQKTQCSECELQEEFSLTMVIVKAKKKGEKDTRYLFLSTKDPLYMLVELYRQGKENTTGTQFFGIGMSPTCR